jgi:NAD-dependent dihydropyrimidine dehydrogenase PreA subunit
MVSEQNVYALPNVQTPSMPVTFDPTVCIGCNKCVETCPIDVFIPNPKKGAPPIILHAEECWYCGCCATDCPNPGAIKFNWPLPLKPRWKNKETGAVGQL